MKRMSLIIVAFVVGFAVGGLVALRRGARTAATLAPMSAPAAAQSQDFPMNAWQGAVKAGPRSDDVPDPAATRRLREKLRQEERRQRPQEGRN